MRHFYVTLRDGIVIGGIDTFSPLDTGVEVSEPPMTLLYKKLVNNEWVDAELLKFAALDSSNVVVSIFSTYFPEDCPNGYVVAPIEVEIGYTYDAVSGSWTAPEIADI